MSLTRLEIIEEAKRIASIYDYKPSLLYHWIETFGKEHTEHLTRNLRKPLETLWVQVNTSRVDIDSVRDMLDEMDFKVKNHRYFEDFLEVEVELRELKDDGIRYPRIIVEREAIPSAALGKDILTADIISYDKFETGDTLRIVYKGDRLLALGKAEISSEHIPTAPQRVIAKNTSSLAYAPPLTEFEFYRRGYFNILTPAQAIGIKSMYHSTKDNILVMSTDNGEAASYLSELTHQKVPITVIAQNKEHSKALQKTFARTKSKSVRLLIDTFPRFVRINHLVKFTSAYLELQNSRSSVIPSFRSNLSFSLLEKMVKKQIKITSNLFRCLYDQASITYVTHSVDNFENEKIFENLVSKSYYKSQSFPREIREYQNKGDFSTRYIKPAEEDLIALERKTSTIFLDPLKIKNTGGFIAKFKFDPKKIEN